MNQQAKVKPPRRGTGSTGPGSVPRSTHPTNAPRAIPDVPLPSTKIELGIMIGGFALIALIVLIGFGVIAYELLSKAL